MIDLKHKMARYFTRKMSLFGNGRRISIWTGGLGQTIATSKETEGRLALIRLWEEIEEDCFEQKFIGEQCWFSCAANSG